MSKKKLKSKKKTEYKDVCLNCGRDAYGEIDTNGITMQLGRCPKCGNKEFLVPARYWKNLI